MNSKISVIVPVYNVDPYLARCIDSILDQTFTNFELILVDDGSTDKSGEICNEYVTQDGRIHVIHQENGGLSAARNAGIDWIFKNSDSEWLTFIDSDDWVHKEYFTTLVASVDKTDSDISCCGFKRVAEYCTDNPLNEYDLFFGDTQKLLKKNHDWDIFNTSVVWCRLFKKSFFKHLRFPVGKFFEDEYVTYKLLLKTEKIAVAGAKLYYYFQNKSGIMSSSLSVKKMSDRLDALEEQIEFFYENHKKLLFKNSFMVYLSFVQKYFSSFEDDSYLSDLTKRKDFLSWAETSYHRFLPFFVKIYGCNAKAVKMYEKYNRIKNDFYCVKNDDGFIRAVFYTIKHIID